PLPCRKTGEDLALELAAAPAELFDLSAEVHLRRLGETLELFDLALELGDRCLEVETAVLRVAARHAKSFSPLVGSCSTRTYEKNQAGIRAAIAQCVMRWLPPCR